MTHTPEPEDPAVASAQGKLARLGVQVDTMQAVLVRLLQDVVRAETRLDQNQVSRLVDANEKLVVAAMTSQAAAEAAEQALKDAPAALDPLTQLPNRLKLVDRAVQAIAHAKRHGSRFALLFLDLDNFKHLNDTHGHAFGDQVLCLVAKRMLSVVREVDTVSRHGGDEFLVLLDRLNQTGDAQAVAEKLIAAVVAPTELGGLVVVVSASVGIAVYPDDGEDIDTLVSRADAAMYQAKRGGSGGVALYSDTPAALPGSWAQPGSPASRAIRKSAVQPPELDQRHAQLREANEKLVLAALTAQELQAAAEQARQRQSAFAAAVAEELRNPAAPIRIAMALLGRPTHDAPLLQRVQGIVEEQMLHMSRLVGNLVEASGADAGSIEPDRHTVDMTQVIDAAIAAHRPKLDIRGQRLDSQRPAGALAVRGDAVRLQQIVGNLLDNASKHSYDGGRIGLSVVARADTLTMTVSDNGIGITQQMLPHVFDTFVQDTHALGFNGVGLGIGLTVARILVQAHGGQLVAHSAGLGRGSQFVVLLPLAKDDQGASARGELKA